jgi:hypothetical protein
MSPYHARLAVFFTSVILAFVAGSLTMLSTAAARRPSSWPDRPPIHTKALGTQSESALGEDELYLPALDPTADQCQG